MTRQRHRRALMREETIEAMVRQRRWERGELCGSREVRRGSCETVRENDAVVLRRRSSLVRSHGATTLRGIRERLVLTRVVLLTAAAAAEPVFLGRMRRLFVRRVFVEHVPEMHACFRCRGGCAGNRRERGKLIRVGSRKVAQMRGRRGGTSGNGGLNTRSEARQQSRQTGGSERQSRHTDCIEGVIAGESSSLSSKSFIPIPLTRLRRPSFFASEKDNTTTS